MNEALRLHVPGAVYQVPKGGYFLWLRLPENIKAIGLRPRARSLGVDFRQGNLFSSTGAAQNYIRLCFAHYAEADIEQGILRLKECLASH
jgi:DNA-binding transcriptional MocR family regulator